jgi:hypothetical protein
VFAVVTMGGSGISALHQIEDIFEKKNKRKLDAGFAVVMRALFPGTFPTGW